MFECDLINIHDSSVDGEVSLQIDLGRDGDFNRFNIQMHLLLIIESG